MLGERFRGIKHIHTAVQPAPLSSSRTVPPSRTEIPHPLQTNLPPCSRQPLASTILLSVLGSRLLQLLHIIFPHFKNDDSKSQELFDPSSEAVDLDLSPRSSIRQRCAPRSSGESQDTMAEQGAGKVWCQFQSLLYTPPSWRAGTLAPICRCESWKKFRIVRFNPSPDEKTET